MSFNWAKTIKLKTKHCVQGVPVLWRLWLDFRHALRMCEFINFDTSTYFDKVHRDNTWDFTSEPHQERNSRLLRTLDAQWIAFNSRVLEIGCSEGVFTAELAKRFAHVDALDVSEIACERTKRRCEGYPGVTVRKRNLCRDPLKEAETYDIIVAMDMWSYLCRRRDSVTGVTERLSGSLSTNGLLIFSECRMPEQQRGAWWQRWFPFGADAYFEYVQAIPRLSLVWRDVQEGPKDYPTHLLAVFRKDGADSQADSCEYPVQEAHSAPSV